MSSPDDHNRNKYQQQHTKCTKCCTVFKRIANMQ